MMSPQGFSASPYLPTVWYVATRIQILFETSPRPECSTEEKEKIRSNRGREPSWHEPYYISIEPKNTWYLARNSCGLQKFYHCSILIIQGVFVTGSAQKVLSMELVLPNSEKMAKFLLKKMKVHVRVCQTFTFCCNFWQALTRTFTFLVEILLSLVN